MSENKKTKRVKFEDQINLMLFACYATEPFFTKQPFYNTLKFQHGDRLFDFDQGIGYRNLTVQVGYVCFCKDDREFVLND